MIRPIGICATHMECRSLKESVPVLTDLLAFEKIAEDPGEATLKHPNTDWLLVVHEAGDDAPAKPMHNHWGVRVAHNEEVDAAYEHLNANKQKYGLKQVGKPLYNHGSYSLYFVEPGTNGWEIECYESAMRRPSLLDRVGGVRAPHWSEPLPAERFPGRGYVPQGFTHGTLACRSIETARAFYRDVMGLEVHQANDHVVYLKHPATRCYVVCAERPEWQAFSPNFRFTVAVESLEALEEAHRRLEEAGSRTGLTELGAIERKGAATAFLLRDPDRNWWEVSAGN
ncbi:MAG TPA: VOC family protein [candidate division Zixibacteria bacterium]|nr:VOC family protein [candidate division Zixibacteria bacterium]